MSSPYTKIAIPKTLQDYCVNREQVVKLLKESYNILEHADELFMEVSHYGIGYESKHRESFETGVKHIDRTLWRLAFDVTGFRQMMDAQAIKEFENSLEKETPEFNEQNVRDIFISAMQNKNEMYARGVVNVFLKLPKDYVTNNKQKFKVDKKAIMSCMFRCYNGRLEIGYGYSMSSRERLDDIDRVFKTLDGKQYKARELESAINSGIREGVFENEYYRIRGFCNGNMHIWFKREDLLDKVNKIISDYYDGRGLK